MASRVVNKAGKSLGEGIMKSRGAKRAGRSLVSWIDSLTIPLFVAAAVVFPAEYVQKIKTKREIEKALERVLESERAEQAQGRARDNE